MTVRFGNAVYGKPELLDMQFMQFMQFMQWAT